jgi:hypothetical protein
MCGSTARRGDRTRAIIASFKTLPPGGSMPAGQSCTLPVGEIADGRDRMR